MYSRYVIISYRSVSGIRGLTRECLIALTADIVTINYRQEFNSSHGMPPEHPRSSTTDDIECFFSVLRDVVGKDFTLKQAVYIHFCRPYFIVPSLCIGLVWVEKGLYRVYEKERP